MRLFWTPASPFTRKVSVAARELGLWKQSDVVPTFWSLDWGYATISFTKGLAEANPVARIPTFVTTDSTELGDSTLICQHLDDLAANATLIPEGAAKWSMWSLYAVADGLLEAQVAMRAEMLRPASNISQDFLAKQRDRIGRCFDRIEARADELIVADESPPNLAQITVGVACGYQDWRDWLDDFRPGRPKLTSWYKKFSQRHSMLETEPTDTPER